MPRKWWSSPGPRIPERNKMMRWDFMNSLSPNSWFVNDFVFCLDTNLEHNSDASVNNPWWLEAHGEAENEPHGGASVCGGQGLYEGQEATDHCQPDHNSVSKGGVSEMNVHIVQVPEEQCLQQKSQDIDKACTLFWKQDEFWIGGWNKSE